MTEPWYGDTCSPAGREHVWGPTRMTTQAIRDCTNDGCRVVSALDDEPDDPAEAEVREALGQELAFQRPIIVLENGEEGPEVHTFGLGDVEVITVDFGRADLNEDEERAEWLESKRDDIASLPAGHPARDLIERLVKLVTDNHPDA